MAELPEMMNYYNRPLGLIMRVPLAWHGQMVEENHLRILAPEEPDFGDYRAGMSFRRGRWDGHESGGFEALISRAGEEMAATYPNYVHRGDERFEWGDNTPVHLRHYEWRDPATQLHFSQFQALVYPGDGVLFLINAATLKDLEGSHLPVFEAILRSTLGAPASSPA